MFPNFNIYPVITENFCANGNSLVTLISLLKAGCKIVQLREKELSLTELRSKAQAFQKLCKKFACTFIINDHVDLALEIGADGVHLGQNDLSCLEARKLAPKLIIGISTHNLQEALQAQADGASYVNIGPIFPTKTKDHLANFLGVEKAKKIAQKLTIPYTVMGGIKQNQLPELISANLLKVAMVTELTKATNLGRQFQKLQEYFP